MRERVRFYLTSVAGVAAEVADAVLGARWGVVPDDVARARALDTVRQRPEFAQLAVAFKRVRNILAKNPASAGDGQRSSMEPAELELDALVTVIGRRAEVDAGHAQTTRRRSSISPRSPRRSTASSPTCS